MTNGPLLGYAERMKRSILLPVLAMILSFSSAALAESGKTPIRLGFRGGVGTDINGGLAYGGGINYLIELGNGGIEPAVVVFGGSFSESSNNGFNDYTETTDVFAIGVMANFLLNYKRDEPGLYFGSGAGFGAISVDWEESSPTDTSLGTLLPSGGSSQSSSGSGAGAVLGLSFGYNFGGGLDTRFEVPVMFPFGGPSKSAGVIPTFLLTLGYRL